jgi:hypothetical protein
MPHGPRRYAWCLDLRDPLAEPAGALRHRTVRSGSGSSRNGCARRAWTTPADAGGGECLQELVESLAWVEVGCLRLERGSDGPAGRGRERSSRKSSGWINQAPDAA